MYQMTTMNYGRNTQLTTSVTNAKCTVCQRQRHTLRLRKSKLNPNMQMFLCNECFDAKREPRFLVILIARDRQHGGLEKVRDYIRNHKYYGDKIRAEELV